ncbi:helix-turn-helix domain-containing protein [Pseudokordiimonas caeni]|uniref:helix-turn-helix domain-containing protein n=1 Tax=Pseudokordiimonas caeni TaxID=2997908 RepID=UPI00281284F2|nr:helix-turn-helix transcriptional regulator [Pseudokordiimonas caeni]
MPDPIDVHVGSRVRMRRTLLGLSQDKLGQALGLTFQQVQKYERGTNRMGASRLLEIARVLDVSPSWFFEDMPEEIAGFGRKGMADGAGDSFEAEQGYNRRETLELVRVFYKIEAADVRQRLKDLLDAVADAEQADAD